MLNFETFCLTVREQRTKPVLRESTFAPESFNDLCPERIKLSGSLGIVGFCAFEKSFPFFHLFTIADIDDLAFGDRFHPFKDLPHHLINDTVKNMCRVARLPVTFGLLSCLAVADIPHTLYNAVSIFLARISLAVGGERQPRATMPAKDIPGQQGLATGIQRYMPFLFGGVGAEGTNVLCGLKQLRRYDLQMGQRLGAAFAATKHPGICQIANDTPDAGVMPHFTRSRPIAEAIVTSGGVEVSSIDPKTMESKLVSGLYFAGEVIDADAYTGGYNLQIAFSTGRLAGISAAQSISDKTGG